MKSNKEHGEVMAGQHPSVREPGSEKEQVEAPIIDRRAALAKLGRYGAYTAPALMALLESEKAVAAS